MKEAEKVNKQDSSNDGVRGKCLIITAFVEGFAGSPQSSPVYGAMLEAAFTDEVRKASEESFVICADGGYKYAETLGIVPNLLVGDFDSLCDAELKIPKTVEIIRVKAEKDDTDTGLCIREAINRGFKDVSILGGIGGRLSHTVANIQNMAGFLGGTAGSGKQDSASGLDSIEMWDGYRRVFVMKSGDVVRLTQPASSQSRLQSQASASSPSRLQSQASASSQSRLQSQASASSPSPSQTYVTTQLQSHSYESSPSQSHHKGFLSLFALSDKCEGVCVSGVKYLLENAELCSTFPLGVSNEFTEDTAEIRLERGLMAVIVEY